MNNKANTKILTKGKSNLIEFLESIEDYISRNNFAGRFHDQIQQGLLTFYSINGNKYSSLFYLNDDTFEFENNGVYPEQYLDDSNKLFNSFIDKGEISQILETGKIKSIKAGKDHPPVILVPLVASWGILGIVLLALNNEDSADDMLLRLCSLQGNLFSSSLERAILFRNLGSSRAILEQKVSMRTMDLAQNRRELKAIFDSVHTGILVLDAKTNKVIKANPVAADMFKLTDDEILEVNLDDHLEEIETEFSTVPQPKKYKNFESYLIDKEGRKTEIIRSISYLNYSAQKLRIESFLDISKQKQAERVLKQTNEELELKVQERTIELQLLINKLKDEVHDRIVAEKEARRMLQKEKELNELKTRFVSMVSHEFRTPLTVIKSSAQMVDRFKESLSPNEQKDYITRIVKTVDLMTDLIENVIFIGSVQKNNVDKSKENVNLKEFGEEIIEDLQLSLNNPRNIKLKYSGSSLNININIKHLRLILMNLLTNAVKYSDNESQIILEINERKGHIEFKIIDNGIGIPEEDQSKIYDLFYRASNVGNISGTGLGMPVVMQSLEILKGEIKMNSKENEGTEFIIKIPVNNNGVDQPYE